MMPRCSNKPHFFVCKQTVFINKMFEDFVEITFTQVLSHSVQIKSNNSEKNVIGVKSSQHCFLMWRELNGVIKNRISSSAITASQQNYFDVLNISKGEIPNHNVAHKPFWGDKLLQLLQNTINPTTIAYKCTVHSSYSQHGAHAP